MSIEPSDSQFAYEHLPEHLQRVSKKFENLYDFIINNIEPGTERSVCLRKLLESKDAAVRAYNTPGE